MLDQIEESIEINNKSLKQSNRSPEQKVSLLKLRKNSKSFGDCAIEKQFTICWFDEEHEITHEFNTNFNQNLTIGDVCNWAILKLRELAMPKIIKDVNLYLPKKKQGKPNEDFPAFRNELSLKDCDQQKFALKVTLTTREFTPPRKIEQRTSYSNSLNKKQPNKVPIIEQKKKKNSNFFCFCYSGE